MSPTTFRVLLVLSTALLVSSAMVDVLVPELLSENLSNASDAEPLPTALANTGFLVVLSVWAAASLAGGIGLFFFRPWSRRVALWSTVAGFGFYPFLGSVVMPWPSQALTDAASLGFGAVLACAYFSSLGARFERQNAP